MQKQRCLLVEDSRTQRKLLHRVADLFPVEIDEAEDGLAAIKMCEEQMPDLIIVDMNMPEMHGVEFITMLRDIPGGDRPAVIVCSAAIDTDDIVDAIKAGANEYHCKSMEIDRLYNKIQKYLDRDV